MTSYNKEPRMTPATQTAGGGTSVGAVAVGSVDPAAAAYKCRFCDKCFATKIGVGVHISSAHVQGANDLIGVARSKARWPLEEQRLFAALEAELVFNGVPPGQINGQLYIKHPGRTHEAIKGRRKTAKHREMVVTHLACLSRDPRVPIAETVTVELNTSEVRVQPLDDDGSATDGDRSEKRIRLSPTQEAGRKAVELLATVSGHGAEKLLTSARNLVEQSLDPRHAIAAWYQSYNCKNARNNTVAGSGKRKGKIPVAGKSVSRKPNSRKALKRASYRRNVTEWRKGASNVADRILTGVDQGAVAPSAKAMFSFWVPIIEGKPQPPAVSSHTRGDYPLTPSILDAITPEEVTACLPSRTTAPGPDGFPARLWRRLPCNLIAGLFNLFAACGSLPPILVKSRTVFVAKKGDPQCPGSYRPISIASVALRHFHRILARRLEKMSLVDERQRAFRRADGVAENIFLLQSVLKDARSSCKGLCLASLDLSKAFDSVTHESITTAMRRVGLDQRFVDYIRGTYEQSETFLQSGGQCTRGIFPRSGVRQGDPLSPLLFNLVVDSGLLAIPDAVGYSLGKSAVNAIAFADDVILMAETPNGLRRACEAFVERLRVAGLSVNPGKCATLTLVPSGRDRKVKTVDETYSIDGVELPTLDVTSLWRYLGVGFAGSRVDVFDVAAYVAALSRISSEPMKAQMRLALARDYLIPKFVHGLTFSLVSLRKLRSLAHETRRAVRRWLDLPTSCPNAYIHSPTSAGGLGVPDFVQFVPKNRLNRLVRLENSSVAAVREAFRLHGRTALASARRAVEGRNLKPSYAQLLHASVDGSELKLCSEEPASVAWLRRPDGIPSSDFKNYARVRINALPTRKRVNRGRAGPAFCRACRAPAETLAHVVQSCPRTHDGRILRHDCIAKRIAGGLRDKGYEVEAEHLYKLQGGNLKPDIVATIGDDSKGRTSVICDVQIVSGTGTAHWHTDKVAKYNDREDLKTAILARHHSTEVRTVAATLTWRGVWEPSSFQSLRNLGLSRGLLEGLVTRVLKGTLSNWQTFNKRNDTCARVGVG